MWVRSRLLPAARTLQQSAQVAGSPSLQPTLRAPPLPGRRGRGSQMDMLTDPSSAQHPVLAHDSSTGGSSGGADSALFLQTQSQSLSESAGGNLPRVFKCVISVSQPFP